MFRSHKQNVGQNHNIKNNSFEFVEKIMYFETVLTNNICMPKEIKIN
jgi:hypothetical protein